MFLPLGERRKSNKEKFQSRKYRFVMFWNILSVISLLLQFILAYLGKEANSTRYYNRINWIIKCRISWS